MYAVIRAGGKQHKVAEGDVIEVERIKGTDTVTFTPLLVVDDKGKARTDRSELAKAVVTAKVLGEGKGSKVEVNKFRNKTGYRRHNGHRQFFTTLEISAIKLSGGAGTSGTAQDSEKATAKKSTAKKSTAKGSTAKKTTAKKTTAKKTTAKKTTAETTAKKTTAKKTEAKED